MMLELQKQLDDRNLELTMEERRLKELDQKFRILMKNKNPASVMKMHDDDLAITMKRLPKSKNSNEFSNKEDEEEKE